MVTTEMHLKIPLDIYIYIYTRYSKCILFNNLHSLINNLVLENVKIMFSF